MNVTQNYIDIVQYLVFTIVWLDFLQWQGQSASDSSCGLATRSINNGHRRSMHDACTPDNCFYFFSNWINNEYLYILPFYHYGIVAMWHYGPTFSRYSPNPFS